MSLALTGDTIAYLMGLGLNAEQMKGLIDRLQRDALSMAPPATASGINEERERLRNESTYAERKRAKDRERQRQLREAAKQSRDIDGDHATDRATSTATEGDATATPGDAAEPPSRTRVVLASLPSLRSEEVTSEPNGSSVNASTPAEPDKPKTKPPKSQRGTRLDPDWEPSAEEFDLARSEGLTDEEIHRAALEFRNYWCARSRDAAKLSWRLTWHNRVIELADRKRRNGARLAASASQPRGGRRGATSFADIFVERHGLAKG